VTENHRQAVLATRAGGLCLLLALLSACASAPAAKETALAVENVGTETAPTAPRKGTGLADEIRTLVETGTPPSLLRALDLIRSRDLSESEFGRAMSAASVTLLAKLYPEIPMTLPPADPPSTHVYARILSEAERGGYTPASSTSTDYLEHVLPFIALLGEKRSERLASALPDLERAAQLSSSSVLDPYFRGIVAERQGRNEDALAAYNEARKRSADCYPAGAGAARVLSSTGRSGEAVTLLQDLLVRYPDNILVKRELARAYYESGDWPRAAPAIAEVLQRDPKDTRFMLMRAHALVEQGAFVQAQPLLDALANVDAGNRLYLFLRARVQAEGYRNRDSAIAYLRSILRSNPLDVEASAYAARLLLESQRSEDNQEGRQLLGRLLSSSSSSLAVVELALKDAITREAWAEAAPLVKRLLQDRRSAEDLKNAYLVHRGLKETDAGLAVARELYERDRTNDEAVALYASALAETGQKAEAARLIDAKLVTATGGTAKSRFYYLRSRLRADEDTAMGDLRSSLFEDPRNLEALMAMMEIYRRRKDDRRTVYYLKQALALAPDDPVLKKYQGEYSALLGTTP
jgi:thioredoxin-like negative regulator of GroEL